jgi:molybdenum cofactor synthesis domain-containing protein
MTSASQSNLTAHVITVSSRSAAGRMPDKSGPALLECLSDFDLKIGGPDLIPDNLLTIQQTVLRYTDFDPVSLLALNGGTGPTSDDVTPEALIPLLDRRYPGLEAAILADGRVKVPRAPLSRAIVGRRGRTIVLALPGSTGGVRDAMTSLAPVLLHLLRLTTDMLDPH